MHPCASKSSTALALLLGASNETPDSVARAPASLQCVLSLLGGLFFLCPGLATNFWEWQARSFYPAVGPGHCLLLFQYCLEGIQKSDTSCLDKDGLYLSRAQRYTVGQTANLSD